MSPSEQSSANDSGYYARRRELLLALQATESGASCSALATELGWSSHETRAKLMSLRTDGLADYIGGVWTEIA
jgi:predicted ArsR family transcriptional regulator